MKHYPIIIVGAGPAGALAGYTLAKAGIEVLILEKSQFPRRKVCGGGLTLHALQQIPFDISDVIHSSVDWGYIASRGQTLFSIHGDRPVSYLVDRLTFDVELINHACNAGAAFQSSERVISIEDENPIFVTTNKDKYTCQYLIGADGVHSIVANSEGLISKRETSLAYEARMAMPDNPTELNTDSITFDFGTILGGYGWIFPKRDHLNVGVCRSWPMKKATKQQLMRFINQHPTLKKSSIIDIRAYPVPLGGKLYQLNIGNILLVGDAANLADPWLGEGLYYALVSGRIAAEAIIENLKDPASNLSEYTEKINSTMVRQFKYARKFSLLVNTIPYLNTAILKSSRTIQNMVIDLLRGEKSYQETWQDIPRLIPRFFRKFFRLN